MAHTLRHLLSEKNFNLTVGESLELISRLFGVRDWNTLSALIKNGEDVGDTPSPSERNGRSFSKAAAQTLNKAIAAGSDRGALEVGLEYLLLALTEDPEACAVISATGVEPRIIREQLLASNELQGASSGRRGDSPVPSREFQSVVHRAIRDADESDRPVISGADFLIALYPERESAVVKLLEEFGVDRDRAVRFVARTRER